MSSQLLHSQFVVGAMTVLAFASVPTGSLAATPEETKGREIAAEWDKRDTGWKDSRTTLQMVLRNRNGDESTRELRNRSLEMLDDGDKLLIVFDEPRDVSGTAFLTFTHQDGPDDQWLYLPALKRVKRIASNNKSGPFMGSEFSYEDLASQEVEKYTYKYLRDEAVNGRDCFVVERYPVDKSSGYTKQVVWFDQETYRPEKNEFYDRKGDRLKTLTYKGYEQYSGEFWRPDEMFMENHQTGKSTVLLWEEYELGTGLDERDFDRTSLQRAR